MSEQRWTAVDRYFTDLLVGPDPGLDAALEASAAAGLPAINVSPNQGKLLQQGVERIIHHLRGVQIGLALGGGAARGMAHLGVLKALEQHGIYVDMLAGTSAGAMTGMIYASGLDPQYTAHCFKNDLRPSWFFRQLPAGGYWYLLYKYRRGQFDPMLRKYLHDLRAEQLVIPMFTMAVDLVDD